MPKIVDHEERREELTRAVTRVIVRDGLESSTIRSIARESGYSQGSLAHYFADKDDLLTSALRQSHQRIAARWDAKLDGLSGIAALRELVLDNLPLDEEREAETRLEIFYWSRALTAPRVLEVQQAEAALLHARIVTLVSDAQRTGEIGRDAVPADVAECLLALIDGLSLHALLYPTRLSRAVQVALIDRELARLRSGAPQ